MKEPRPKKKYILYVSIYVNSRFANEPIVTESRSVVAWGRMGCGIGEWITDGPGETLGMMGVFIILTGLIISQVCVVYIHIIKPY